MTCLPASSVSHRVNRVRALIVFGLPVNRGCFLLTRRVTSGWLATPSSRPDATSTALWRYFPHVAMAHWQCRHFLFFFFARWRVLYGRGLSCVRRLIRSPAFSLIPRSASPTASSTLHGANYVTGGWLQSSQAAMMAVLLCKGRSMRAFVLCGLWLSVSGKSVTLP